MVESDFILKLMFFRIGIPTVDIGTAESDNGSKCEHRPHLTT